MCNLYSHTSNRQAILDFTKAMAVAETVGNLEPQTGIFPDYMAPVVRNFAGMRQLTRMRWGLPSSQRALYLATLASQIPVACRTLLVAAGRFSLSPRRLSLILISVGT